MILESSREVRFPIPYPSSILMACQITEKGHEAAYLHSIIQQIYLQVASMLSIRDGK